MALTFKTTVGSAFRGDEMLHGFTVRQIDMLTSTGSGGADYAGGGFDLQGNASAFGLRRVYGVVMATARDGGVNFGNGTVTRLVWPFWDQRTGKLRFFSSVLSGAEVTGQILANDVVNMILFGV